MTFCCSNKRRTVSIDEEKQRRDTANGAWAQGVVSQWNSVPLMDIAMGHRTTRRS
jgi:hypothetical protein